jgi:antitoxin VapB
MQSGGDNMAVRTLSSRPREAKLFRNNRSQAVRIPAEFELPGDRVLIRREGAKLIIEPVSGPRNIVQLLAKWKTEEPLGPEDQFPEISDPPLRSEEIL